MLVKGKEFAGTCAVSMLMQFISVLTINVISVSKKSVQERAEKYSSPFDMFVRYIFPI